MSEVDSFIREVEEEVRQDRMFRLWKKYGPFAIAGIVGIVAASAGLNWYKHWQEQQARATGAAFIAAADGTVAAQEPLLAEVQGPAHVLAEMRVAAAKAAEGDVEGAAAAYRAIAGQPGAGRAYADLARLQAIRIGAASMDPAAAVADLEPLTAEGAPYRLLALELRAAIRLNAGAIDEAHADLTAIMTDSAATRSLRERAAVMLLASGGTLPGTTQ